MKKKILFTICWFLVIGAWAQSTTHEFDAGMRLISGEDKQGSNNYSLWTSVLHCNYEGSFALSPNFSFLSNENLDAITSASVNTPLPEVTQPINALTGIGLEYRRLGLMQLKATNHVFRNSKELAFPVYYKTNNIYYPGMFVQRFKNVIDYYWALPIQRFKVTTNVLYNDLIFDYYRATNGDTVKLPGLHDADLWGFGEAGFSFLKQTLWLKGSILAKNDLNEASTYDLIHAVGGVQWNFLLFKKKLRGTAELYARYYHNEIMLYKYRDYADDLGGVFHVRAYGELINRLYLKMDYSNEFAPHKTFDSIRVVDTISGKIHIDTIASPTTVLFLKQRYEISIRRAFTDLRSNVEGGAWITAGGLVPRVCGYLQGTIGISDYFDITPGIRGYYMWQKQKKIYDYVRTDLDLMLKYNVNSQKHKFLKGFSVYCGGTSHLLNNLPSYVSNYQIYMGISNYLL